ncbi:Tubulin_specific chaperone E [Hexamita inflata]|uniref:Tubulin_specific chaperone E n=1 Tax=Hexamita inflata TaxID=28002 RepID=A0ABP1KS51_9EUKA
MNSRVRHSDTRQKATVKFIGPINNQEFYGICYDDPSVGKYDGTYENVRYFMCEPKQGAFVKSKKLITGIELYQLIEQKYLLDRNAQKIMKLSDGQLTKDLEFCGMEMVDHWHKQIQFMPCIGFEDSDVAYVKNFDRVLQLIPGCQSLDLSDSLLSDVNVLRLVSVLPNLTEINLSKNLNMRLSLLSPEVKSELQQVNRQVKLQLNSILNQDTSDLNALIDLPCFTIVEMNGISLQMSEIKENSHLQSLSVTNSLQFTKVKELEALLKKFPNLTAFQSLDILNENYFTENENIDYVSKLTTLNLQNSGVSFDSLMHLRQLAPNVEYAKIMKIFHSKQSGLQSIFQSDQVIPLMSAIYYQSIKQVNAVEIRKKHLSDYCTFYLRYQYSLEGFQLASNTFFTDLAIKYKMPVKAQQCVGLDPNIKSKLELLEEQKDEQKTISSEIGDKYKQRLLKVVLPTGKELSVLKSTPIWKFQKLLKENGIEGKEMVFEDGRIVDLDNVRFGSLLEEFREYYCSVK